MAFSGAHSRAGGGPLSDVDILRIRGAGNKITSFKFTTQDARSNHGVVSSLGIPLKNCFVRLFWDSGGVVTLPSPADFYSWFALPIQEAIADGIEWFEFLNEPNHPSEWKWGITSFTTWAKQVITLIKQANPRAKIISPGLMPDANTVPGWDQAFAESGLYSLCDGIGAHAYGTKPLHLYDPNEMRHYQRFAKRLTGTQKIWVTEVSLKFYDISTYDVGKLYGEYVATLEDYVQGAWFFVLQGDAFESSGESWASRPDIPRGLAEYVPTPLPPTQYVYQHYHLDGGAAVANKTVEITMNAPHTIVGDYGRIIPPVERFPLAYSTTPAGVGKVTVTPASTDGYYDAGTIVRVDFS